jgi:outer membrane immunogenic protein
MKILLSASALIATTSLAMTTLAMTSLAMTSLAHAADLPSRAAVALPVAEPVFSWSGFYAGVHGAWLRDEGEAVRTGVSGVSPAALPSRLGLSDSGLGGGAQVGYLLQVGRLVAGLEADLTVLNLGRSRSFEAQEGAFALRTDLGSQIDLFGTLKGRVGVTMPSLLPVFRESVYYVTGGLAYAQVERSGRIAVTPPGLGPQSSGDDWTMGFVIGGGTEHALTETISLKTETLYYNLADESLLLTRAGDLAVYRFENDGWLSRVGLNVRF